MFSLTLVSRLFDHTEVGIASLGTAEIPPPAGVVLGDRLFRADIGLEGEGLEVEARRPLHPARCWGSRDVQVPDEDSAVGEAKTLGDQARRSGHLEPRPDVVQGAGCRRRLVLRDEGREQDETLGRVEERIGRVARDECEAAGARRWVDERSRAQDLVADDFEGQLGAVVDPDDARAGLQLRDLGEVAHVMGLEDALADAPGPRRDRVVPGGDGQHAVREALQHGRRQRERRDLHETRSRLSLGRLRGVDAVGRRLRGKPSRRCAITVDEAAADARRPVIPPHRIGDGKPCPEQHEAAEHHQQARPEPARRPPVCDDTARCHGSSLPRAGRVGARTQLEARSGDGVQGVCHESTSRMLSESGVV